MKANDYFAVAIRVIGVILIVYGLRDLLDALLFTLGYFTVMDTNPRYYLVFGLGSLVLGIYFLRGAALLVDFAFPNGDEEPHPDNKA